MSNGEHWRDATRESCAGLAVYLQVGPPDPANGTETADAGTTRQDWWLARNLPKKWATVVMTVTVLDAE